MLKSLLPFLRLFWSIFLYVIVVLFFILCRCSAHPDILFVLLTIHFPDLLCGLAACVRMCMCVCVIRIICHSNFILEHTVCASTLYVHNECTWMRAPYCIASSWSCCRQNFSISCDLAAIFAFASATFSTIIVIVIGMCWKCTQSIELSVHIYMCYYVYLSRINRENVKMWRIFHS